MLANGYNVRVAVDDFSDYLSDKIKIRQDAMLSFSIDTELCEDYYFSVNLMRTQLNEIFIAKPRMAVKNSLKSNLMLT